MSILKRETKPIQLHSVRPEPKRLFPQAVERALRECDRALVAILTIFRPDRLTIAVLKEQTPFGQGDFASEMLAG